ncbi:Wzz/FepE/Etk N-terminal domain-containing protein [Castellaniella sp.]|uniref:Wzz/FepE/Etk N-terminal domain-containing protein n=1 Tax=Castellaniella sp. TaxID=1955812 RepID=UPI003D12BE92
MVQREGHRDGYYADDNEVSLSDIVRACRAHKGFIVSMVVFFFLLGLVYIKFQPKQEQTYTASAIVEVGNYVTLSGEIEILEHGGDLARMISQVSGVNAQVFPGSDGVLKLEATSNQSIRANELIQKAVDYAVKRHHLVEQKLGVDAVIRSTAMVGDIHVKKNSIFPKDKLILTVSVLIGFIFSAILVLLRGAFIRRRGGVNVDMDGRIK